MNNIINFIKKYFNKDQLRPLGRWNIDYCNKKLNKKIDMSNEDHCGPCGQYVMNKINKIDKYDKIDTIKINK
jgi:hypothetical protein